MIGIDVYENQQHALLVLTEGVDARTVAKFRHLCDGLLARGTTYFIIDLSQTQTMDSAGIAALVYLFKQCRALEGTMQIGKTMSPAASRIMRLTRFDRIFEVVDIHHRSFNRTESEHSALIAEEAEPTAIYQPAYQLPVSQNAAVLDWQSSLDSQLQWLNTAICTALHSLLSTAVGAFVQRVNRQFSLG